MARDKFQTQLNIKSALSERDTRVAVLIVESIRNSLDLLDEQSPTVLEAMLDIGREHQRAGAFPKHRRELREAFIKYVEEQALKEARARERRLFQGITGLEEPDTV
jgi:hypothetical protein